MMLVNSGTPFDEHGWGLIIAELRALRLRIDGGSNDLNAGSVDADQGAADGPLVASNNLSDLTDLAAAQSNLGMDRLLPGGGTALATTVYDTAGSGTHVHRTGAKWAIAVLVGGGGGGQAGSAAAGSGSFGGAGGAAGGAIFAIYRINGDMSYTVGAGGSGGVGGAGTDGSATSLGSLSAPGGPRGGGHGDATSAYGVQSAAGVVDCWAWSVPGESGHQGYVSLISYNGTGNITSVSTTGGRGGYAMPLNGSGGDGGGATQNGSDGQDGYIKIVEIA